MHKILLTSDAEFMALHGQGTGHCTTHTHLVEQEAKTQTDDLVENPEFQNSGMQGACCSLVQHKQAAKVRPNTTCQVYTIPNPEFLNS